MACVSKRQSWTHYCIGCSKPNERWLQTMDLINCPKLRKCPFFQIPKTIIFDESIIYFQRKRLRTVRIPVFVDEESTVDEWKFVDRECDNFHYRKQTPTKNKNKAQSLGRFQSAFFPHLIIYTFFWRWKERQRMHRQKKRKKTAKVPSSSQKRFVDSGLRKNEWENKIKRKFLKTCHIQYVERDVVFIFFLSLSPLRFVLSTSKLKEKRKIDGKAPFR